jgi:putative DNA primase/helicase
MDFLAFCRAHGVLIDETPPIGAWRRYKTEDKPAHRNGAVKFMGDHGFVQNHATETEVAVWRPEGVEPKPRDVESIALQRKREHERRALAIRGAREFWGRCSPLGQPHPYIARKGLSSLGCAGLRTKDGLLVVPVMVGEYLVSLQTITPQGEKRFWPGAPVKAGAYLMNRPRPALTCFVEGLATGLAIYQSVPQASVVVAFDCGNLQPVAERLKPRGSVVVCADNDHRTQALRGFNPGLEKARNAAELIGCGVAHPTGIEGSDWCDYLAQMGEGAARRLEREVLAAARFVMT